MDFSNLPTTQEVTNAQIAQVTASYRHGFLPNGLPTRILTPWITDTILTGSLTKLSDELILEIIKHLSSRDLGLASQDNHPARNVLSLGLCCRRLYGLVLPTAFSSFYESDDIENSNIAKFLCRILAGTVGGYVKHLVINARDLDVGNFECFDISDVASWDPENLSRLKAAVDEASKPSIDASGWYSSIETGNWDAWVALLLSQLPNLEVLDTTQYGEIIDERTRPWLLKFLQNAAVLQGQSPVSPLALPKLREISFYQDEEERGVSILEIVSFTHLRSVKTLRVSSIDCEGDIDWKYGKLQFSTTDLTFDISPNSDILDSFFRKFLEWFPSLECLYYTGFWHGITQAEADEVMQAIIPLYPTLLNFSFDIDEDSPEVPHDQRDYVLGSFVGFEKLKSISVLAESLTGTALDPTTLLPFATVMMRSLPRSLETLTLVGTRETEAPSIMALIRSKNVYTPFLKELNLYWETIKYPDDKPRSLSEILYKHSGFTKEEACELWEDCKEKGVKMVTVDRFPPTKFVNWTRNIPKVLPNGTHLRGYEKSLSVTKTFEYPYNGYEAFVREKTGGFDPDVECEGEEYGTWN